MVRNRSTRIKLLILAPLLSLLIFAVACGGSATSTAIPPTTAPVDTGAAQPTAVTEPTAGAPAKVVPTGVLRYAIKDLGPPQFVTQNMAVPQCNTTTSTVFESLWHVDPDGVLQKRLLEDWSISDDGFTWTLNLKKGIPFHGGGEWGEFTATDLLWSAENLLVPESRHPGVPVFKAYWRAPGGSVTKIDEYTIEVNTGTRIAYDFTWSLRHFGAGCPVPAVSSKYIESVGIDTATLEGIGTGPWELIEFRTNEVFQTRAVLDHWRKTPNFEEMRIIQIPEESTRIANFLAGQLDTMQMALTSIPALVDMPGIKFKRYPGGLELRLNIHGQWYVERDDRDFNPVLDPSKAWISASGDVDSPEWEAARKVREALSISIDRQAIVDTLLEGEGTNTAVYSHWLGFEAFFDDEMRAKKPEFNVERARQLLADAGWADGFDIDMALTQRSYPGGPAMGEAVCLMWQDIGVQCKQERTPMTAYRPTFLARTGQGINTHDNGPSSEPISIISNILESKGLVNMGVEHPRIDELIAEIQGIGEQQARFAVQRELAKFIEHNVINIPVVHLNLVWPIGPEIDVWELNCCGRDLASNMEFIPHRGQ